MKGFLILLFLISGIHSRAEHFVFVFLNKKQHPTELPKDEVDKLMEGHMANINRLAKEGKLAAAGPFEGGGGIFIFRSTSKQEVQGWLETDPAVKAGRWAVEILDYEPRAGSVCSVKEPYEMTSYAFVRYEVSHTKYTLSKLPEQLKEHEQYLKQLQAQGEMIAEGTFGAEEGGILVMKKGMKKEVIELDPAVQKQFLLITMKELYIARGSFCEK